MFTEMIKSEFKQLKGTLKLALVSIAIITGNICFNTHLIFLIIGVKSTGAIVLWYFITGIINMFLQFLYPLAALCLEEIFFTKICILQIRYLQINLF